MNRGILVDTSFLYALFDTSDKYYAPTTTFVQSSEYLFYVPRITLVEAGYLAEERGGRYGKITFFQSLTQVDLPMVSLTDGDTARTIEILLQYQDSNFDFVDCAIMALSERLQTTQVATFDKRDFTIFKPKHNDYLEIVPG